MKTITSYLRTGDWLKLLFLITTIVVTIAIFFITPTLSTPTLLSIVAAMMLGPTVTAMERRGYSRRLSILVIFLIIGSAIGIFGTWATTYITSEFDSFKESAPEAFEATVNNLKMTEVSLKTKFPMLERFNPTDWLIKWGQGTGSWLVHNGPAMIGDLLTWLLLVPFLTYVLLKEGRTIRRRVLDLVPNRFFESTVIISTQVTSAISDYIRAKFIEAFLVGAMTTAGLAFIGSPYAIILGAIAGVTNIIPYLGPFIGAAPGILIILSDASHSSLLVPVCLVYLIANIIDTTLIFPVFVAKLVNLHPLILIAAVIIGQQYYGVIGMLISIPATSALKVIINELYWVIYKPVGRSTDQKPL